jgi:hypothetical protein
MTMRVPLRAGRMIAEREEEEEEEEEEEREVVVVLVVEEESPPLRARMQRANVRVGCPCP